MSDVKTERLLAQREAAEEAAEYAAGYFEYEGVPIPLEEPK